jgi:hypothetical protein
MPIGEGGLDKPEDGVMDDDRVDGGKVLVLRPEVKRRGEGRRVCSEEKVGGFADECEFAEGATKPERGDRPVTERLV